MKKKYLFPLIAAFLMSACSSSTTISFNSEVNYDSDPNTDVTDSGDPNSYDDSYSEDDPVDPPSEYDSFTDGVIPASGRYLLEGEYPTGISITASKGSEIYVFFKGANISSTTGIAFGSSKNITLYVVILDGTINYVSNDVADTNAFHVKGEVHISGSGTPDVTSGQKNAIKVSKDLYVSGDVRIRATGANHGISARSLIANGVEFTVNTTGKDGIQTECDDDVTAYTKEQGFVYLVDTNLNMNVYGDGVQAETYVYISGGTQRIETHGEFVSYSSGNMSTYGLTTDDFKFVKSGNTYKRVATDEIRSLNSNYYALTQSCKGVKVGTIEYDSDDDGTDDTEVTTGDYEIYIAHLANMTINSTDDCIHTNYGNTTVDSSNLELDTFDDGVHADYELNINNAHITINSSYEGLEGANVTVDGENTNIVSNSQDDGINAASDLTNDNNIIIRNGYFRVFAKGDGLDANTALYLEGGTVIVEGPGSGNGSLDAEQIYFRGGIVFACSSSGMTERMTATQNTFLWQGSTITSGAKVSIVDAENNAIFTYTLKQSCNQVIFSSPDLAINSSYKIMSDSTVMATINMTSSLTKVGNSGGGPGGGGHGPGF